jgi:Domain of unknown function DUF29
MNINNAAEYLKQHLEILLTYLLKWRFFEGLRNDNWRSTVTEHRHHLELTLRDSPSLKSYGEDALRSVYPSALLAVAKDTGISFDLLPEHCPWELENVLDNAWMPGNKVGEETISHDEFRIGTEFYTESGLWRCTDVGTRTIVAVQIKDGYPAPDDKPPFVEAVEVVFDEYDFGGLYREPVED